MGGGWLGKHGAQGASSYFGFICSVDDPSHRHLNSQGRWIHSFWYRCLLARSNDGEPKRVRCQLFTSLLLGGGTVRTFRHLNKHYNSLSASGSDQKRRGRDLCIFTWWCVILTLQLANNTDVITKHHQLFPANMVYIGLHFHDDYNQILLRTKCLPPKKSSRQVPLHLSHPFATRWVDNMHDCRKP